MSALLFQALGAVCPACDHYNPPGAQRCVACGAALLEAGPAKPAAAKAPAVVPTPIAGPGPAAGEPPGMRPSPRPSASGLGPAPAPPPRSPTSPAALRSSQEPIPASELVRKPAQAPVTAAAPSKFGLLVVSGASRGQRFRLPATGCQIGRAKGAVLFPDDVTVQSHHATMLVKDGRLYIRDEGSLSGVFVTIGTQEILYPSGFFSVGQRLFRYLGALNPAVPLTAGQPTIYGAPIPSNQVMYGLEEVLLGGRPGRAVVSAGPLLTIGQQHCDLSYPKEEEIAARHCELSPSAASASLRDLSGGLGTFIRIGPATDRSLNTGDRVRIGGQVLQVEAA